MTKDEVIELLSEYFTEGMVRTIIDNLVAHEREECAKLCDAMDSISDYYTLRVELICAQAIRARGKK
jgi:hypothetical protein